MHTICITHERDEYCKPYVSGHIYVGAAKAEINGQRDSITAGPLPKGAANTVTR